ncbi:Acetoin utilization deacetylase AcuC [Geoalkalibacter ferrihydriticus]|uniref:Histone deacetylase n=2 Tax=Geoalkalibacter ferrihydriticus TaxID=392333 RepID=A0A0C2HM48_9BACT|nr:histone deacetylase family protein [Geoalkalibacter ferrihydriticus]KIH76055.1 histone deacetylase [Geoalkalibacter ferrihydriticus DSM 17813]SDM47840.1 Acetoin utilization deacetylase AcuC [Geoalkalibacter ferrihydriticus]
MFRIRRIYDDLRPINRDAIAQAQQILRDQFPDLNPADIEKIPELLRNPLKHGFRTILHVAENQRGQVRGFALLSYDAELRFAYLDYISAARTTTGGGIGGALYEHVREEARELGAVGIFFECLPDDAALCRDEKILKQNQARLRFYEKYGALPIIGTAYETPLKPGDDNPPYLVFDPLGQPGLLSRDQARAIVRAILERRYGHLCSPGYIQMVVDSFGDDPIRLRPTRYVKKPQTAVLSREARTRRIALVVNDRHAIHHVRERGYVESPVRIRTILRALEATSLFEAVPPREYSERFLTSVHAPDYVQYFKRVCRNLPEGKSVYPYVFPIRNAARPPVELAVRAGYFCIDTFTPLNRNAWLAAKRSVDCALTAADLLLEGYRLAYALVRPPGHHAERRAFGGFCYFNNAALAAQLLSAHGPVAILDIDYHHGNGQQVIFYERADVLTVSIHGHPRFAYPYFSGFEDEAGEGEGRGFNFNLPLAEQISGDQYLEALHKALKRIVRFRPAYLVVSLGLDTAKGDPTGTWSLAARDFERVGRAIGALKLPTLVVQEGGYRNRVIGTNARNFFTGLWQGALRG